jgi:O-antigen ligase/Tfp pilus assembly protein PilF
MRLFVLTFFYFLLPVAFWTGSTSYESSKLTLLAFAGAALAGHAAWRWRGRRELNVRFTWLIATGIALLLVTLLSLPKAGNRGLVLQAFCLISLWLCIALATAETITTRSRLLLMLGALIASASLCAIYGLLQIKGILAGASPQTGMPPGISSLGNQNYLAELLAVVFFPSLLLLSSGRRTVRVIAGLGSVLVLAGMVVCSAAGPMIALLATMLALAGALFLLARRRPAWVPRWYGLCMVTGLCSVAVGGYHALRLPEIGADGVRAEPNPVRRLYNRNAGPTRMTDWYVGWEMLKARPLTGVGFNNYKVAWPEMRPRLTELHDGADWLVNDARATKTHNEFIQLAAEGGLPGVLLLVMGGVGFLLSIKRRFLALADRERQRSLLLLFAGLSVAALHALVGFPAHLPATVAAVALILGAVFSPYLSPDPVRWVRLPWHPLLSTILIVACLLVVAGAVREFRADLQQKTGQNLYMAGRYAEARSHLEKAVAARFWPGNGRFYLAASGAACGADAPVVEDLLRRSLLAEPTYEAFLLLAETLRDQQSFAEARGLLDKLEACGPTGNFMLDSRYIRGTIALREGEWALARTLLEGLLQEFPQFHRGWLALGYLEALQGRMPVAASRYQEAMDIIDDKLARLNASVHQEPATSPAGATWSMDGRRLRLEQHRRAAVKALESVQAPSSADIDSRETPTRQP